MTDNSVSIYEEKSGGKVLYIVREVDHTDSIFYYDPNFFKQSDLASIKTNLFSITDWRGKDPDSKGWAPPRLQRWSHLQGEPFSRTWPLEYDRWHSLPYPNWLLHFQEETSMRLQEVYDEIELQTPHLKRPLINSVLLSNYRDGLDKITLHRDHLSAFGINPTIVGASFGASRQFNFMRVHPHSTNLDQANQHLSRSIELEEFSVLIMAGSSQVYFAHEVPVTADSVGPRISATLREHLS